MLALKYNKSVNKNKSNSSNFCQNNPQTNINFFNFRNIFQQISSSNNYNIPNFQNLSICEGRIIKDIYDLYKKESIKKKFNIILHELKKIDNTGNFVMFVEFSNIFVLKFVFPEQYPYEPPKITYCSGLKFANLFDDSGNIILEIIKKEKWTPVYCLCTLIGSIELKIENNLRNNNIFGIYIVTSKKLNYRKRKWTDYLKETQDYYKDRQIFTDLNCGLKRLKNF